MSHRRRTGNILIITGLILIGICAFIYLYSNVYKRHQGEVKTERVQEELYDKFTEGEDYEISVPEENEEEYKYVDMVNPIAYIYIPKIGVKAVVADGTEDSILRYAVGHFEGSAMPGEKGNCALAGHRNYDTGEFFLKINKLNQGDDIIISTHEKTFNYKVTESFVVNPEDTYVVDNTEGFQITLVTCTYNGKQRLVVRGELEE